MAYKIIYTKVAVADLVDLPKSVARRIDKKLEFFAQQSNPLAFAKRLTNSGLGTHRFRIGDYRVIFDLDKNGTIQILLILSIKHRREVYKFL